MEPDVTSEVGPSGGETGYDSSDSERVTIPDIGEIPVIRVEPGGTQESFTDRINEAVGRIRGRIEGDNSNSDNSGEPKRRGRPRGSKNGATTASFSFSEDVRSSSVNLSGIVRRNIGLSFHQASKLYGEHWNLDKDELDVLSYFGTQGAKRVMPEGDIPMKVIAIGGLIALAALTIPRIIVTSQLLKQQRMIQEMMAKNNVNYQHQQDQPDRIHQEVDADEEGKILGARQWTPKDDILAGFAKSNNGF